VLGKSPDIFYYQGLTAYCRSIAVNFQRHHFKVFLQGYTNCPANRMFNTGDWFGHAQIWSWWWNTWKLELNVVKVQNWIKTIQHSLNYALTTDAVKNWREWGVWWWRIKERLYWYPFVAFADIELPMSGKIVKLLNGYLKAKKQELVTTGKLKAIDETEHSKLSTSLTNLGTFRAYFIYYFFLFYFFLMYFFFFLSGLIWKIIDCKPRFNLHGKNIKRQRNCIPLESIALVKKKIG